MSDHCDEALANLYTYLDGELNDETVFTHIRDHLVECPPCGEAFTFERRLRMVVRNRLREEVPIHVMERLRMVIREEGLV